MRGGVSDGSAGPAIRGVAFEISREKQAEARLAAAEGRLKDAIENISEAFVLWDRHGRLVMWNGKFAEFYGLAPGLLAEGARFQDIVGRADANSAAQLLERYAAPADSARDDVEAELAGGRWAHISLRPTSDGGAVSIATDVTELKRQERDRRENEIALNTTVEDLERSREELREAVAKYETEKIRAEDANRSKSEFLAGMSHELRTPLNAINGFSEIMLSELYGPLGDEKYKSYVNDILVSGNHLLELIEDILDMSKIEAGKMQLDLGKVELKRVLGECLRLLQRTATDADVSLSSTVAHIPSIWGDARAVKQILLNILANAVKFTPAGGSITVTADADLDSVALTVADTGVGIAAENLGRLGVAFEQIESQQSRRHKGSGLGLALSKSLMELQRGVLAIASEPGRGTRVTVVLPRHATSRIRLPSADPDNVIVLTRTPDDPPHAAA
ncbi:MAG: PAS domain-containing sensor histidine kinase [Pseudomonadota bacterium]